MRHQRTRYGEEGFTYLALLLMIAVMGAVMGAAMEVWHTAAQREKEQELLFVGDQFRAAIRSYYLDHSHYPHDLVELLKDPQQAATRRYLRKLYRDPITGKNEWGMELRPDGEIIGVHSLSGAQPIKVAGFAGADSSFEGADQYSKWLFMYVPRQRQRGR